MPGHDPYETPTTAQVFAQTDDVELLWFNYASKRDRRRNVVLVVSLIASAVSVVPLYWVWVLIQAFFRGRYAVTATIAPAGFSAILLGALAWAILRHVVLRGIERREVAALEIENGLQPSELLALAAQTTSSSNTRR